MGDKIFGIEPKYKVGDIVQTTETGKSWKFIVDFNWIDIDGEDEHLSGYHYMLRDGGWVAEPQITDIMDALPD
jgi:hypothetical protein